MMMRRPLEASPCQSTVRGNDIGLILCFTCRGIYIEGITLPDWRGIAWRSPGASKEVASEEALLEAEQAADEQVLEDLLEDTHRILKQSVDRAGPKRVARALDVSLSLVYKWTQPPRTKKNPGSLSGARNPLDKLVTIYHLSEDLELIQFLCRVAQAVTTRPIPTPC
jgi:hypothetical protein